MASLKDVASATEQLEELAGRLHAEATEGRADFGEMTRLADEVGEFADALAGTFLAIDEALVRRLAEPRGGATGEKPRQRSVQRAHARNQEHETRESRATKNREPDDASSALEELSREDLLTRARELEISGRSTMSKDELVAAIQSEQQVSKDALLERAKDAGIPGRSTMSKEELAEAVRSEESLSREALLERAREADIPGRSDMSKEELREALSSH